METLNNYELYKLCNKKNLFTGGTCEQYEKLFEMNRKNTPIEQLAIIIWVCSKDKELEEILEMLRGIMIKVKIKLTQEAYITFGRFGEYIYRAEAKDENGTKYNVFWEILESYKELTEEEQSNREDEACDWENPTEIINLDTLEDVTKKVEIV